MPTKKNRADQQQNYVPAGNGDASGEYADNESGSNKHFTNFKKPDSTSTTQTGSVGGEQTTPTNETKSVITKDKQLENIKNNKVLQDLKPKQKYETISYIYNHKQTLEKRGYDSIISALRYYNGSFGDLSKYSDEEIKGLIDSIANTDLYQEETFYIKSGGKWKVITGTQKQMYDLAGVKTYDNEQKVLLENKTIESLVNKSQSSTDKEMQDIMGKDCVVCFGKGYSKEDTQQIVEATKVLVDEFPQLKQYVSRIGDRNNLEKYINATKDQLSFSEDEITKKMKEIKSRYFFGAPSDEKLRALAQEELKRKIKIAQHQGAYAYWSPSSKSMIFLGVMKKSPESQFQHEFDDNFKSSNKKISVYYHEMGHGIDSMLDDIYNKKIALYGDFNKRMELNNLRAEFNAKKQALIKKNLNPDYGKEALEEFNSIHNTNYQTMSEFDNRMVGFGKTTYQENMEMQELLKKYNSKKYNLSRYGSTNNHEFVAESFAAYYTGMNNELANETVALYKEFFKKLEEY